MEVIFGNSGIGGNGSVMSNEDEETYEAAVRKMIDDAIDYELSYLALAREENQRYYNGIAPTIGADSSGYSGQYPEDDVINKSTFVSTDVRDTILTVMPSLIRIFTGTERIADFIPHTQDQQDLADEQMDYASYVFYQENEGFLTLHSVLKDALSVKIGIVRWETDVDKEITEEHYTGLDEEQYQFLLSEMPDVEVTEMETDENGLISASFRFEVSKPAVKVVAVPPENFRIARDARTVKSSRLVGYEEIVPVSDLVKKGYDEEELIDMITSPDVYSEERYLRNPGLADDSNLSKGVLYGEYYIRIDGDGDGIDELRHICVLGSDREIIQDRAVSSINFAVFNGDPKPHTAIGDCLADITKDIQRIKTNMMRGQLDNLAESINPRSVINELNTNVEDALNDEVGAVIRTRGDPAAAVHFLKTPYAGADVQVSIDYLDQVRASRTGITEASKGLDPKAMQSTALSGIDAIVSGAQERIELIARILAETGMKDLMVGIIKETVNNPNKEKMLKLRGGWKSVNPSLFDPTFRVEVNPTIGKGSDMARLQALADVRQVQEMVITKFGIANPIVTPVEYFNTIKDMLALTNIKNFNRYFKEITPEILEGIQNAPKEPDPAMLLAQSELEKTKKDMVLGQAKQDNADSKLLLEATKAKSDDDFRRDKLNIDASVKVAEIFTTPTPDVSIGAGISGANQPPAGG